MRVTTPLVVGGMVYAVAWLSMDQAGWWGGVITCTTDGTQRFASKDHGFWIVSETLITAPALAPPIWAGWTTAESRFRFFTSRPATASWRTISAAAGCGSLPASPFPAAQ